MTAPDPSPAALAAAEADWAATPPDLAGWVALSRDTSRVLRAEYERRGVELDRLRARIAAVLNHCREIESQDPTIDWDVPTYEIRALLEGELESEPPPAHCGVGFPMGPMVRGLWVCCLDSGHDGPHRSQRQIEREGR